MYLFHKAMDMVASDGGNKDGAAAAGKGRGNSIIGISISSSSIGGGRDDLPRAGQMMAGLGRQSQTLAVYLGLEDAPEGGIGLALLCVVYGRGRGV